VLSVSHLSGAGGATFTAANVGPAGITGNGFTLSEKGGGPQMLNLWGWGFVSNAPYEAIYQAGFEATEEIVIPATGSVKTTEGGLWSANVQVIDGETKQELTQVKVEPSGTGQYKVDEDGNYTFFAGDADRTAVIRFGFVPWDISFAATQLIGEWFAKKDRIGYLSKTLGGQETVTFSQGTMSAGVRESLQPYMNVVPV
jgi:hypothetical protein